MALEANKILAAYMTTQQTLILCYKDFEKFDVNLGTAKLKATKFKFENSELQSLKVSKSQSLKVACFFSILRRNCTSPFWKRDNELLNEEALC
jgi:hypothetical protein